MKFILSAILMLLPTLSIAQVSNSDAQYSSNGNLLINPSFENGKSSWTNANGTFSVTSTSGEFTHLKNAGKVALSSQALSLLQSISTVSGSITQYTVGISYKVPSAVTDFQVCALVAGSESVCVPSANLIADNLYHQIEIPVVITPGSTVGIKVKTTATYTQNLFFDAAYIKQGLGEKNLTTNTNWTAYTPTFTAFGSVASTTFLYRLNGQNVEIKGRFTVQAASAAEGRVSLPSGFTALSTLPSNPTVVGFGGRNANTGAAVSAIVSPSQAYVKFGDNAAGNNYIVAQNSNEIFSAADDFSFFASVPVNELGGVTSVYSSTNANYDWVSYTPTIAGLGTLSPTTNFCKHRRLGGDLEVECSVTVGTTVASLGSISLPNSLTLDSARITAANTTANPGQKFGDFKQTGNVNITGNLVTATGTSTSLIYIGGVFNSATMLTPANGSTSLNSSLLTNFSFKVPISGWSNSNVVVASLAGTPTIPGNVGVVDTFSVAYGTTAATTVCSASPCTFISQDGTAVTGTGITRSGTGAYTIPLQTTYTKLWCNINATGAVASATVSPVFCTNCSSASFTTYGSVLGTAQDTYGTIGCKGMR